MTATHIGGARGPARSVALSAVIVCLSLSPVFAKNGEISPSINDFGSTGLIQMPSARHHPDGEVQLGVSRVEPYIRGFITVEALPWLEATFRYTDIGNRPFSNSPAFSGNQTFKDRSVDAKVRLVEESQYLPEISVQLRDLGADR